MDSRGPSLPPSHHHQHHQQPPHHHHQPPQQGMILHHHQHQHQHQQHHHSLYSPPQNMANHPQMMAMATPNNRFPFNNSSQQQQQVIVPTTTTTTTTTPTTPTSQSKTTAFEPLNSPFSGDGSLQSGFGSDHNPNSGKKKRGRPRKYSPDGGGVNNIALGLAPTPLSPSVGGGGGGGDSGGPAASSEKKQRGRPPGSSKKQLDALGNCGVGFTPHVILVNAGEDIAQKILAFSKQGPRTVCVLSANGSICNVSLRQPAHNGGVVNYEGRFEIISLSGSFLFSENNFSGQVRTGGLSVSLAGSDGRVLGGSVAGMLKAAAPVQIIVGSFIANGKKTKYMPSVPQSQVLSFAAPPQPTAESPPSQDVSSEGSEENGSNHIDRTMGSYGNSNHPVHNMPMYNPMGWHSSAKMLQN